MSELIRGIVLGLVQGITEFLPVSSDGHLELAKYFLGDTSVGEESLFLTIILHVATTLSIIVVFRKDIADIFKGLLQFKWNAQTEFSAKVVVSMIPAVFDGLFFEEEIESMFSGRILLVAGMLVLTGFMLVLAQYAKDTNKPITYVNAFIIGIAQAFAIAPGLSRSGCTISTSVMLGIDRNQAAKFSFLIVIPLILGKLCKDILDGHFSTPIENTTTLVVGFVVAFLTGLFACRLMLKVVQQSKLIYFAIYCFIVAISAAIYILTKG
jgi:undecaprenyl-diphosphatase